MHVPAAIVFDRAHGRSLLSTFHYRRRQRERPHPLYSLAQDKEQVFSASGSSLSQPFSSVPCEFERAFLALVNLQMVASVKTLYL